MAELDYTDFAAHGTALFNGTESWLTVDDATDNKSSGAYSHVPTDLSANFVARLIAYCQVLRSKMIYLTKPVISSFSGSAGYLGTTTITLTGQWLTGVTSVTVGGATVAATATSDASLHFVAPAHAPGTAAVVVIGPAGVNSAPSDLTYA